MKPYVLKTEYACGIDLHSRQMYVCIMDRDGNIHLHTNIKGALTTAFGVSNLT